MNQKDPMLAALEALPPEARKRHDEAMATYQQEVHAVQSGIAMERHLEGDDSREHKHLQVGNDIRAVDHTALVRCLVAKGLLDVVQYVEELAREATREKERIAVRLTERMGTSVTLQ